ncbi:DUF1934 domain-containing protein [Brevibacillus sp. SYP-B805]|uniref:DUF1934 domain-containing protein n=1 Tax=Brevibacillus sp. SYP-B805 TaxID=1578199 RepID=UPI0013EA0684|nr:DUF1934 domain-containing protein [Brevibacillus sp. SYP-B805]NGQ96216.1 DUF1934 domain-containing protein [Brevibacillus sp. SYP-B805]
MQNVTIQLVITHTADRQTERTELRYPGRAANRENGWYFSYTEQVEGIGEVGTILKIALSEVTLLRQGKLQMKQVFAKGKSSECHYVSPHGRFRMETYTRMLRIEREEERPAAIRTQYQLWLDGQYLGEYELDVRIDWE